MKRTPVGIDNFGELINPENNYIFVDRTALIAQLLQEGAKVVALHAFRRMGKSLFASMLQYFFSPTVIGVSTQGIFQRLAINQLAPEWVQKYQGQYPVVMLSLKSIKALSFRDALKDIYLLMRDAYLQHPELITSMRLSNKDKEDIDTRTLQLEHTSLEQSSVEKSLKKLTELLYKHHGKKVWLIIDEYDTPLTSAYQSCYYAELLGFMKNFLGDALKGNDYLEKGILTGILRLTKESILSGLNNPAVYSLLNPGNYQPYFGFTQEEVKGLFIEMGLAHEIEHVREWYNGYQIGEQSLYNPWSIINCLHNKGDLRAYWVNTASEGLLQDCLGNASDEIKAQFEQLVLKGGPVEGYINERIRFEDLQHDEHALWSLLYATGYLTANSLRLSSSGNQYVAELRIPNREVSGLYVDIFQSWLQQVFVGRNNTLLKALIRHDFATFAELIQDYLLEYASVHHLKYEGCYHSLVLGLLYGLGETYYIFSGTLESGYGYSDLLLIPRERTCQCQALLLEFKHTKKNETGEAALIQALAQIEKLQYKSALRSYSHITSVRKVGMAFYQKQVFWQAADETL